MKINKEVVAGHLQFLSSIPKENIPLDKKGNLDVTKFNKMKEVKQVIKSLQLMGVKHRKNLMELGFVSAGMILNF